MRLYRTRRGNSDGQILHWYATQAEAKKAGRASGWSEQVEVPIAKPAMLAWLNSHTIIEGMPVDGAEEPDTTMPEVASEERIARAPPPPPAPGRPGAPPLFSQGRDADQIVEAILDLEDASKVGQVADAVCDKIRELTRRVEP